MKKRVSRLSALMCVVVLLGAVLGGCSSSGYTNTLDQSGIFENKAEDALPQTIVAELVREHFASSENPKVLLIGFDGTRADALFNVVGAGDDLSGSNEDSLYSGINHVRSQGGLYLMYCGGPSDNKQNTDTAPGFASALTGVWADEHGVEGNESTLNFEVPTVLRELAEEGKTVSFTARWTSHFTVTYKDELALGLENYTFNKISEESEISGDNGVLAAGQKAVENDEDCIFVIFENPDANGHGTGFGNDNYKYVQSVMDSDRLAYSLIQTVEARDTYEEEDWLILMFTDHGGRGKNHGSQREVCRMIYLASNKELV